MDSRIRKVVSKFGWKFEEEKEGNTFLRLDTRKEVLYEALIPKVMNFSLATSYTHTAEREQREENIYPFLDPLSNL